METFKRHDEMPTEQKLHLLLASIMINYNNINKNNTNKAKYAECYKMIIEAKKLIEELKIEIINLDSIEEKATPEKMLEINRLTDLLQVSSLSFDMIRQIIVSLKKIQNALPDDVVVVNNLEKEIHIEKSELDKHDDFDEIEDLSIDDSENHT